MRITRRYDPDPCIDIEPGVNRSLRRTMVATAAAGLGLAAWLGTGGPLTFHSSALLGGLSGIALALAYGRPVYSFRPNRGPQFRFHLFGIPVLSQSVPRESLQAHRILPESDGSFTLRFFDVAGQPSLTLERFPDRAPAEWLASLCLDGESYHRSGVEAWIETELAASRQFSPFFQVITVLISFATVPLLVSRGAEGPTAIWIGIGIVMTAGCASAVRRDRGVIDYSVNEEHVDLWMRKGIFRIVEVRQWLDGNPEAELISDRKARWPWVVLLLCVLEAGVITGAANWAATRDHPKSVSTGSELRQSEAVQRGAEMLEDYMNEKRATESLPKESPPRSKE